jgi:hypothetical protein
MESSLEETFKALQEQAEHLERCLNSQNPEDETKVYLQELANSRGKSMEQLKDDVALFSQKIHKIRELSVQGKEIISTQSLLSSLPVLTEFHLLVADLFDNYWDFFLPNIGKTAPKNFPYQLSRLFCSVQQTYPVREDNTSIGSYMDALQRSLNSAINAALKYGSLSEIEAERLRPKSSVSKSSSRADESLRAIAYSMDLLLPGFYAWVGNIRIRIGGSEPDDTPYRYSGTIHSPVGIALVLPGYRIFTTYQGTHDPRQA